MSNLAKGLLLTVWVGVVLYAVQYIFAYGFVFLLGGKLSSSPVYTTIYNALIYVTSFLIILFCTPKISSKIRCLRCTKPAPNPAPNPNPNPNQKPAPATTTKSSIANEPRESTPANYSTRAELGLTSSFTWTDIGLSVVGFVVYLFLAGFFTRLMSQIFPWFDMTEIQNVGYSNLVTPIDKLLAIFSLVIVAPIAEEAIFRGWLYGKLRAKLGIIYSILLTSLLFGIMHGQWNVGVNVFAMSLVLCIMREITGTIYSGIFLHMLKNAVAFYLLFIIGIR